MSNGDGWLVVVEALALAVCNIAGIVSLAALDVPIDGVLLIEMACRGPFVDHQLCMACVSARVINTGSKYVQAVAGEGRAALGKHNHRLMAAEAFIHVNIEDEIFSDQLKKLSDGLWIGISMGILNPCAAKCITKLTDKAQAALDEKQEGSSNKQKNNESAASS
ncbi:hypothetical protein BDR06DRAFT_973944 [Suillus hirtellus]|nr:hypothetical protein BDR06DRAFT_973944 [Suillus hirtellus]